MEALRQAIAERPSLLLLLQDAAALQVVKKHIRHKAKRRRSYMHSLACRLAPPVAFGWREFGTRQYTAAATCHSAHCKPYPALAKIRQPPTKQLLKGATASGSASTPKAMHLVTQSSGACCNRPPWAMAQSMSLLLLDQHHAMRHMQFVPCAWAFYKLSSQLMTAAAAASHSAQWSL